VASATFVALASAGLAVLRYFGGSPDDPEGALAACSFGAPFAAVALLAVVGTRGRRPWLLVAAGVALYPMSFISFAGVALPLLVPAGVFVWHGVSATRPWPVAGFAAGAVAALGTVAALVVLLVHPDPASWYTATGGGSTSDVITTTEAVASLAVLAGAVVTSVAMTHDPRSGAGR
jgi:hypothetical protein